MYKADDNASGALTIPLHCMLDEFANIGKIPEFPILISTMHSRNMSVSVILQTISQIKALYKDEWETITANCDSKLFLGGNDETTTKWYSTILGNQNYLDNIDNGKQGNERFLQHPTIHAKARTPHRGRARMIE